MLHLLPALLAPATFHALPPVPAPQADPTAHARPNAADPAQGAAQDLFQVRLERMGELCRHPKDQGLARVFGLLQARLAELPGEVPGAPPIDPAWIALAGDLSAAAKSVRFGFKPGADINGMEPPFYMSLSVHNESEAAASALEGRVLAVLRSLGAPEFERGAQGLMALPGTPMPVHFGATGSDLRLDVDAAAGGDAAPLALGDELLPKGARALLSMQFDYAPLVAMMMEQIEREDPRAAQLIGGIVQRFGLDELSIHLASASDAERSYAVTRFPGFAETLRANGMAVDGTLTTSDFGIVPRDATWASVSKANVAGMFEALLGLARDAMAMQGMEGDPVEMIAGMTGFNLRDDFISILGDTYGMYASDTTGGGGMMSTVLFMQVRDAERAIETRERLDEMLNGVAALQMQGYMQVRAWSEDGVDYATMMFPGLPVPMEPTIAITDQWMFVGASSGAAVEAVRQARTPGAPNLLDHPALRAQLPGGIAGIQSLSFQDSARYVRDGYGSMRMVASALANGVRSRLDGMRDAGQVLPPFQELVQGVQATVTVGRTMGNDWVIESRADASMVVSMTALCGWLQSNGVMLALPMLAGVGASQQAIARDVPSEVYTDF